MNVTLGDARKRNILVMTHVCIPVGYMPRSGLASHERLCLALLEIARPFPKLSRHPAVPHCMKVPIASCPRRHLILSVF